jgi:hypothetical protein
LAVLNSKAASSNIYTKEASKTNNVSVGNAINNKADKLNTYLKSEIDNFNNVLNDDITIINNGLTSQVNTSVVVKYQPKLIINNNFGETLLISNDATQLCNIEATDNIIINRIYTPTNINTNITYINYRLQIQVGPDLITTINNKVNTSVLSSYYTQNATNT